MVRFNKTRYIAVVEWLSALLLAAFVWYFTRDAIENSLAFVHCLKVVFVAFLFSVQIYFILRTWYGLTGDDSDGLDS